MSQLNSPETAQEEGEVLDKQPPGEPEEPAHAKAEMLGNNMMEDVEADRILVVNIMEEIGMDEVVDYEEQEDIEDFNT